MGENDKELLINSPGDDEEDLVQKRLEPERKEDLVDDTSETSIRPPPISCCCSFVVEPAVILYAIAGFPMSPLVSQYTYAKVAEHLGSNYTNLSTNNHHNVPCVGNVSDAMKDRRDYLQQQVSQFGTYSSFAGLLPAVVMLAFYGAYSDRFGRKTLMIIPPFGVIATCLLYMAIMYFDLPLYTLLATPLVDALGGSMTVMLLAAFAFIADTCPPEKRAFRMAFIDIVLYIAGGLAELGTGYWIEYMGFFWPFLFVIGFKLVTAIYVILFIPQTIPKRSQETKKKTICSMFTQSVLIFTRRGTVPRRRLRLAILAFCYVILELSSSSTIRDYFSMNAPLCWDSIHIGYYHSAYIGIISLGALIGSKLFACCLNTEKIVILGLISGFLQYCFYTFVRTSLMMYMAPVLGMFHLLPIPLIRSLISGLVSGEEQGATLAALMIIGTFVSHLSSTFMYQIYSATLTFMPGLVFLVSASKYVLAVVGLSIYMCMSRRRKNTKTSVEKVLPGDQTDTQEDKGA